MRRTTEQRLALFDQHRASGLTQTEFAKQQGIDPTYFSYRKRQLLAWQQEDDTGFVELHFPPGTDTLWLAALLRAL
ncbi:MAG: IS66 family insertion sequence element accessory protein TnpB [Bacteroidetes bacterium]|nr:IS66 family insertion sequence element accessory protein TnpB [Bacteroidota bacterium]